MARWLPDEYGPWCPLREIPPVIPEMYQAVSTRVREDKSLCEGEVVTAGKNSMAKLKCGPSLKGNCLLAETGTPLFWESQLQQSTLQSSGMHLKY